MKANTITTDQAARHIGRCNSAARSVEGFRRLIFLCIASQRVHSRLFWPELPNIWAAWNRGESHKMLRLSHKRRGTEALRDDAAVLNLLSAARAATAPETLWAVFTTWHGLGVVKAGFAAQLFAGVGGCIDTVNQHRLGIDKKDLSTVKKAAAHVEAAGGTVQIWTDWINAVAARDGFDAEWLSVRHAEFIESGR